MPRKYTFLQRLYCAIINTNPEYYYASNLDKIHFMYESLSQDEKIAFFRKMMSKNGKYREKEICKSALLLAASLRKDDRKADMIHLANILMNNTPSMRYSFTIVSGDDDPEIFELNKKLKDYKSDY